jgi:hypothetical protein
LPNRNILFPRWQLAHQESAFTLIGVDLAICMINSSIPDHSATGIGALLTSPISTPVFEMRHLHLVDTQNRAYFGSFLAFTGIVHHDLRQTSFGIVDMR